MHFLLGERGSFDNIAIPSLSKTDKMLPIKKKNYGDVKGKKAILKKTTPKPKPFYYGKCPTYIKAERISQ